LDSHTGEQVMDLIAEFNRRGQTILLATHDRELARRYTQRVVELRDGNLIRDGSSAPQLQGGPSE
jgi:putative ABC transport system ATP-binding protein